jgi:glyceraldehyde-3-phosphate dehydrogenase (NAD(P))
MAGENRTVLVIGTGTIGEPLIGLLADLRDQMGIDEVIFHKRTPLLEDRSKVVDLIRRGAKLAVDEGKEEDFQTLGMTPTYTKLEAIDRAAVVIDCTPKGYGMENKREYYRNFEHNTRGFIAQGSEFGFGVMYVHGVNDEALVHGEDRYIQVVSCNTHNLAVLIHTLALSGGRDNLIEGRFVCMRRANDISQHEKFVPSPTVSDHIDERFGTHHARDAHHLFRTLGLELNLFSSAIKLNTQYMHTIWFDLRLKRPTTLERVHELLSENPRIAITHKHSANLVFSFGRDHGHYGRILNNTVVVLPSLHVSRDGKEIHGFCFTPQDGNSLLSSVAAALWFLYPDDYRERLSSLQSFFFQEV